MKIGRIKEIKSIGTFSNFSNGASCGFEKLTFIYGFNTFGKTTLTDIFQSLKNNSPQIIESRKTIPEQNIPQKVVLTEKKVSESDVEFKNNAWSRNFIGNNLEIFGADFIHKNLFTGLTIERGNRENFTQFILGEQGVKYAEEIANRKKTFRDKKKALKEKIPYFVKDKTDDEIKEFLLSPLGKLKKDEIEKLLLEKKSNLKIQEHTLEAPQEILSLPEPSVFNIPKLNVLELIENINTLLLENYSGIKDELLKNLKKHIDSNFTTTDNAENWIKSGIRYCKDQVKGDCPFCSQPLEGVQGLMEIYNLYFSVDYNKFIYKIDSSLSDSISKIDNVYFSCKSQLQDSFGKASQFKELITNEDFKNKLSKLREKIELLQEDDLNLNKRKLNDIAKTKHKLKNAAPFKKIEAIDIAGFKVTLENYTELISEIKNITDEVCLDVKTFKKSYEKTQEMQKRVDELKREIDVLEYQKARIEQDSECKTYVKLQKEIFKIEKNIVELQEQLRADQTKYLDNYFTEINVLFGKLGSKNFTLEKGTDNTGYMPVYYLKVKFHGKEISNDQLKAIFSESDKRALSLAIFLAKINLMDEKEKRESIIILDDPVVSFDDNRITNSINIFKENLDRLSQMVILTHYPHFIKRFCEITKEEQHIAKFIRIEQNATTSFLTQSCREEFIKTEYERTFMKIYNYINRRHQESIKTELRPFLENLYLPTVFAKRIQDRNVDCDTLESMIDGIFDEQPIKRKLHEFRVSLNPDSHIFTSNNNEDIRNFASEMLDYLYSISFMVKS